MSKKSIRLPLKAKPNHDADIEVIVGDFMTRFSRSLEYLRECEQREKIRH